MKVCKSCNKELHESLFGKEKRVKSGLKANCQGCLNAKGRASPITNATKMYREEYRKSHPEIFRIASAKWKKNNPDKVSRINNLRRSQQSKATLSGYEKEIEEFYWLARDLKAVTGEKYHVDHIVPLRGANVCGLHVPWNLQILPADINLSKSNTFDDIKEEI